MGRVTVVIKPLMLYGRREGGDDVKQTKKKKKTRIKKVCHKEQNKTTKSPLPSSHALHLDYVCNIFKAFFSSVISFNLYCCGPLASVSLYFVAKGV